MIVRQNDVMPAQLVFEQKPGQESVELSGLLTPLTGNEEEGKNSMALREKPSPSRVQTKLPWNPLDGTVLYFIPSMWCCCCYYCCWSMAPRAHLNFNPRIALDYFALKAILLFPPHATVMRLHGCDSYVVILMTVTVELLTLWEDASLVGRIHHPGLN